jgi:hypothetical protein
MLATFGLSSKTSFTFRNVVSPTLSPEKSIFAPSNRTQMIIYGPTT